jgi:glutamate-1-semialdehyde 2,1-aminomutase
MATLTESRILQRYRELTPNSARLAREARQVLPSGVAHDSRYLEPYPIFVERAAGAHKWDVDGREYVDYSGGHGALLLGHNHPRVVAAVAEQLQRGTHFGACHELEIVWGRCVQRLIPSAERVRFTSSGTEATLLALRIARAATGRPKIMRLAGHFHGWHDHMAFGVSSRYDGSASPGVLDEVAKNVVLVAPGDTEAAAAALQSGDVAAVILEPTGASWGQVPLAPHFVAELRELTAKHAALLIFDEVISGFRCAPGGAQQALGIEPDLTTLAKILAGGLPGGAVAGRADLLEWLEFPAKPSQREKISHHGTFNANPLSAAAGIATLEIVETTDACERANDYAARLRDALNAVLREERVPWVVYGTYSGFHFFFNSDRQELSAEEISSGKLDYRVLKARPSATLLTKLRLGMLIHGVEIFSWPGGPTSACHNDRDLQRTADALRETVRMLKDEDEIES